MVKIKTNNWLQRLKGVHGEEKLLEELNGDMDLFL